LANGKTPPTKKQAPARLVAPTNEESIVDTAESLVCLGLLKDSPNKAPK
jgi:hypothetical protein